MHYAFINTAGELTRSWDAGRVTLTNGEKTFILRDSGLTGEDKLTASELNNSALGYMVDGLVNGCNPAAKKEREYAAHVLSDAILKRVPDSAEVVYAMPSLDDDGRLTGDFTDIYSVTMRDVRRLAETITEWTPVGNIIAERPMPKVLAETAGKPAKGKPRKVTLMEWDEVDG